MAIDPKLLVIKPVDELERVTGLQAGDMLFYDGLDNLKRISIDTFNNLSQTAKPLNPTDPAPTVGGLYAPTKSGTYSNAGGLIAQESYYTLFFFNGTTWTKSEVLLPGVDVLPVFDPLNELDAQGGKQINDYFSGVDNLILADANYTDANINLTNGDRTFIINTKQTKKVKVNKLYIKAFAAGNIGIHKYSVDGSNNAVRIYANTEVYTLTVGLNEITLKSELQELEINNFIGIVQNTGSLLGRVAGIAGTQTAYNYWSAVGNVTNSNVGSPITATRIGIKFEAEIEGKIETVVKDLIGNFDTEIEPSFATPPKFAFTQIYKSGFVRNTSTGMFRLSTGELIATCSSFVAGVSDHDPSSILLKISYDNGTTWRFYSRIEKSGADIGIYNGDFYYIGTTLHCIALVKTSTSPLLSKIVKLSSTDHGKTWGAYSSIVPADFYHVQSPNRIHSHNGILFYPYSKLISGDGNSSTSTYYGRLIKSTDNGATWVDGGVSLQGVSPDNLRVEGGFFTNSAGALVYRFRTTTGNIIAYNSTDNGVSFGAEYTLIANVANSMSAIKKLQNSTKWVSIFNDKIGAGTGFTSRKNLKIATSTNGTTFTTLTNDAYTFNDRDYPFEPCIYEDNYTNGIIVTYSISNTANTEFSAGMIHLRYSDL